MGLLESLKSYDGLTTGGHWNKNEILRLRTKGTRDIRVRILPPKDPNGTFFAAYRNFFGQSGPERKDGYLYTLSPSYDPDDPLYEALQEWHGEGKNNSHYPNMHNSGYSNRYYLNVSLVTVQEGRAVIETDDQGLPVVHPMTVPKSVMDSLVDKLKDAYKNPNANKAWVNAMAKRGYTITPEQASWSFISDALAYPVHIKMISHDSSPDTYEVEVDTSMVLAPLKQGWEENLEDLEAGTTPTYKTDLPRVEHLISYANAQNGAQPVNVAPSRPQPMNVAPSRPQPHPQPTYQEIEKDVEQSAPSSEHEYATKSSIPVNVGTDVADPFAAVSAPVEKKNTEELEKAPLPDSESESPASFDDVLADLPDDVLDQIPGVK
jgi:hypothetical protein